MPNSERTTELSTGTKAIDQTLLKMLADKEFVSGMVSTNPRLHSQATRRFIMETSQLLPPENKHLVTRLIQGQGTDDPTWNQDRRDAALEALKISGFRLIEPDELLEIYLRQVRKQDANADPLGPISSLAETGVVIADHFIQTRETRDRVSQAWEEVSKRKLDSGNAEDAKLITEEGRKVSSRVASYLDNQQSETPAEEKAGWREKPDLKPTQQALHDKYLEICSSQGSIKRELWDKTPEFRQLALSYGINLPQFWNIHSTEQVAQAAIALKTADPKLVQSIDSSLKKLTGTTLSDITYEQAQVVSDQIITVLKEVRTNMKPTPSDFDSVLTQLRSLAKDPRIQEQKFRRNVQRAINSFFDKNGITTPPSEDVIELLSEDEIIDQARVNDSQRRGSIAATTETIDHLLTVNAVDPRFSITAKSEDDLYVGDKAGDCTSYHLNIGMNAWTTPAWASDPGFSMFTINDNGSMIAKFGMFLSLDGNTPVLVIDSVESGKDIKDPQGAKVAEEKRLKYIDEETAKAHINDGLKFLNTWAKKAGLQAVYINTVANSSDLTTLLKDVETGEPSTQLTLLGGVSGLVEFQKGVGMDKTLNIPYVQSENNEVLPANIHSEIRTNIQELEGIIVDFLKQATPEQSTAIASARYDWPNFFKLMIDARFPQLQNHTDTSWDSISKMLEPVKFDSIRNELDFSAFYGVMPARFGHNIVDTLKYQILADNQKEDDDAFEQVLDNAIDDRIENDEEVLGSPLNEFLQIIKIIEAKGATMPQAMELLYGKDTSEDAAPPQNIKIIQLRKLRAA